MRFTNHKPSALDVTKATCSTRGGFDPSSAIDAAIVKPLFEPLVPNAACTITINGQNVAEADVANLVAACIFDPSTDPARDAKMREILEYGLVHFDKDAPMALDEMFVTQAAVAEKLDFPDKVTVYTPASDIIPIARELLAGASSFQKWFASLALTIRDANTLGVSFADENAFDRFKTWVDAQVNQMNAVLPPETIRLFGEFQKLNLAQLTESLLLRKDSTFGNDEMSFARVLPHLIMDYYAVEKEPFYGILPFSASQAIIPESVVFVNVSLHSQATPKAVHDEWAIITRALQSPIRIMSQNQISKLTAAARTAQKMAGRAATAHMLGKDAATRALRVRFRNTAPTVVDLSKMVRKVIEHMANVQHSHNSSRVTKPSFMRPNRRDPDNYNLKGQSTSIRYKPDIHLYVDTSGSISERNYQDAVKACIALARHLNVNLYFNSFSHVLSTCTYMPIKGRSTAQVYKQFQNINKVGGGTDYEQVWRYINASPKRKKEFSLLITDFEYYAPSKYVEHPENLYYAPCSQIDWNLITTDAQAFCNSMRHIDPLIRRKILI